MRFADGMAAMPSPVRVLVLCLLLVGPSSADGEVIVRWNQTQVPAAESLGISTLVIPAANTAAVQDAVRKGYRVYLEAEGPALANLKLPAESASGIVVSGTASAEQLQALRRRLSPATRVFSTVEGGAWPHVRLNWVTLRNDVLQVSSRTAQPWIESNAARVRLAGIGNDQARLLTYTWEPITISDMHQGPALENYLVAIAEAGTFGTDLVLPLHEGFQRSLLLGRPDARADWQQIRRYLDFYSWDLPARYQRISNIGVITAQPTDAFEVLNLLTRHNLSYEVIAPQDLPGRKLESLAVLIVTEPPGKQQVEALTQFARGGGTVVLSGLEGPIDWQGEPVSKTEQQLTYRIGNGLVLRRLQAIEDPNDFALDIRDVLGRDKRTLEIWNGVTVLAAPYQDPDTRTLLITLLNYAHVASPIQLRVRGTYSTVHYETPEAEAVLVPFRQRDGQTEFVLPELHVGGRVFLSRDGPSS
jgi:hypothetical protein